ncbi:Metallo-dependent phosphatase-like protein [Cokeromyces recurvatus]|uniref:Metallo-dependent phosphatase-like protein n=1 Tax=Cokeromyces recurvatus TaxID=90255 RepID=UPI002220B507|nr:Metallo-dependent phosphatase-like protein [Cokeromyces recurvatus]KAI7906482.1 Metallo-dependent phosphatase-like protein [Cokeromyces recurvatus]
MHYFFVLLLIYITSLEASSISQAFFTFNSVTELENKLCNQIDLFLNPNDPDDARRNCDSCINLLSMAKRLCFFPEPIQLAAMKNICRKSKLVDNEVCEGIVREQGPIIRRVLKTMDISGRDGHLLCASVFNSCPYPDVKQWKVRFPKPKPTNHVHYKSSNKTITVLHLSDWHIDPQYEEGTETKCSKPICCRRQYTDFDNIANKASPWGAFGCDSPLPLIETMLEYIPIVAPNISFAILTGDIPPHEVWETLPIEKTKFIQDTSYALLHSHFDSSFLIDTKLYPSIGNHESAPTNLFPLKDSNLPAGKRHEDLTMTWLYDTLVSNWKGWIPSKYLSRVHKHSGSYVAYPVPGLKLISMNTNFCYNLNWWLYEQPTKRDPNGLLKWFISQLQESEDNKERVWISGHTSPGDSSCFHDYANYYYQIIERYAPHVIAGQFFGHTHRDEFQIFYKNASQKAKDAISIAYIAPSVTPYPDLNPGFRTYTVDTGTFEVIDTHTYIADLNKSTEWELVPNWHKEYSAKQLYGSSSNTFKALSPSWWHKVTEEMELDDEKFDLYWLNRYKSSPLTPKCDLSCRTNAICSIRAGKSELRCDYDPSSSTPRPVILNHKERDACGVSLLKKVEV